MSIITSPDQPVAQAHKAAGDTEREAALRIAPKNSIIRGHVLRIVACRADGMTAKEAFAAYCQIHGEPGGGQYTISPRLSELLKGEYVRKGERREHSRAYVVTAKGLAWVQGNAAEVAA